MYELTNRQKQQKREYDLRRALQKKLDASMTLEDYGTLECECCVDDGECGCDCDHRYDL